MTMTAFAIGAPGAAAQEAADVRGRWSGTLTAGAQQFEIVWNLHMGDDGSLSGTMDVPAQGAAGIPLTTVQLEGRTLTLTFPVPGGGSYEGTLSDDGEGITGTFTQAGQNIPMDLSRGEPAPPPARPQEPNEPFPYSGPGNYMLSCIACDTKLCEKCYKEELHFQAHLCSWYNL